MNVSKIILLSLFLVLTCTLKADRQAKYADFPNDLERDNLYGKVKEIIQFKANYIKSANNKTDKPIIQFKTEYTTFGKVSNFIFYSNLFTVKFKMKKSFEYNEKGQLTKSKYKNEPKFLYFIRPVNTITIYKYDESGNEIFSKNILGNKEITNMEYDSLKNITKHISTNGHYTFKNEFSYVYNEKRKILSKRQLQISPKDTSIYVYNFNYNSSNNLISSNRTGKAIGEISTIYEYSNEILLKTTDYQNGMLVKETLYDKYYNPISEKEYKNNILEKEFQNSYIFDAEGNWIKKIVEIKDIVNSSTKFSLLHEETRNIQYY